MTHAEFEYELVEALNMLLEDERASVEMEVALASGATEYSEREALSAMGLEDIHFCDQLRAEMERAGLPVTPQINGIVFQVIDAERYDDRLRAFARHQRAVAERASELQESNLDGALREALEGITSTHARHTQWTERRADAFAATRTLEFGSVAHSASAATTEGEPEASASETMTQQAISEAPSEAREAEPEVEVEEVVGEVVSEVVSETTTPSAEQPVEVAVTEEAPAKLQPKPRAPRAPRAARTTTPAKATKTTAKPKAAAKPKATSTAATRRTRRAPAEKDASEA